MNNDENIKPHYSKKVDIIISAFNEEKLIVETSRKVLSNDYPNLSLIVVDDGSDDQTYQLLNTHFSKNEKVTIISKKNSGKAKSLNYALSFSTSEIVVFIDADTHVDSKFINKIISNFYGKNIVGLAGQLRVRNRVNMLTIMQHTEYLTLLNLEREWLSKIGILTTIPGAVCAFVREHLVRIEGFHSEMITEDCDVTLRLIKKGWKIKNAKNVVGLTEAPESIKMFIRQRVRWDYGLLQNLLFQSKNFAKKVDKTNWKMFFIISYSWLYKFLFKILFSLADFFFLISLFQGFNKYHQLYLYFIGIDTLLFSLIFFQEVNLKKVNLIFILPYRIFYRHLIFFCQIIACYKLIIGNKKIWLKIERYTDSEI